MNDMWQITQKNNRKMLKKMMRINCGCNYKKNEFSFGRKVLNK